MTPNIYTKGYCFRGRDRSEKDRAAWGTALFFFFFNIDNKEWKREREKLLNVSQNLAHILILCSSLVCFSSIEIFLLARNLTGSHCACWRHPKLTLLSFPTRLPLEIFLSRSPLLSVTLTWGLTSPLYPLGLVGPAPWKKMVTLERLGGVPAMSL